MDSTSPSHIHTATKASTFRVKLHRRRMSNICGKKWTNSAVQPAISTGGHSIRGQSSPFKDFHLCHDFKGAKYEERYRVTDEKAKQAAGRKPSSVFKCVGPSQVGPGSVAGMRFLGEVRKETNVPIWPFDTTGVPNDSTVVEIYPRLFLHSAGIGGGGQPTPDTVAKLRKCYQATLQDAPVKWTDDEWDALISAAGMGWFVRQPSVWEGPTGAAKYEGWIFGVE